MTQSLTIQPIPSILQSQPERFLTMPQTITVYTFEELDPKNQEKILNEFKDINLKDWFQKIYSKAIEEGIVITNFDLIENKIYVYMNVTLPISIKLLDKSNNKTLRKIAKKYKTIVKEEKNKAKENYLKYMLFAPSLARLSFHYTDEIGQEYLKILKEKYESLTSKEAIIETLQSKDYKFVIGTDLKSLKIITDQ